MSGAPNFQATIVREREARGLGKAEFARLIGVSRPSLDAYEEKGQLPKLEQAALIAQRLGLTLDQLAGSAPPPSRSQELAELSARVREAAETQQLLANALRDVAREVALLGGRAPGASGTG